MNLQAGIEPKGNALIAACKTPKMELLGMSFNLAGPLGAERESSGEFRLDQPHERFANPRGLRLHAYGLGPFVRLIVPLLPDQPGVYAVCEEQGEVLYIGRARDSLRRRWGRQGYSVIDPRNCFVGGQSTNCRLNSLIAARLASADVLLLWYHVIEDPTRLEQELVALIRPPWNIR